MFPLCETSSLFLPINATNMPLVGRNVRGHSDAATAVLATSAPGKSPHLVVVANVADALDHLGAVSTHASETVRGPFLSPSVSLYLSLSVSMSVSAFL